MADARRPAGRALGGLPSGMTDNPYAQPQDFAGGPQYLEPKTSVLAVFAFVVSVVGLVACCIPGVGPLGLLLGVLALVMISMSGGRKKGGGFAIAAIVIGLVAGAINIAIIIGANVFAKEYSAVGGLVEAVENRNVQETQSYFASSQGQLVDEAAMRAWGEAVNADYGAMQPRPTGLIELISQFATVGESVQPLQMDVEGEYPRPDYASVPLALPFEQGSVLFMVVIPKGAPGLVGSIVNAAYEADDGSLVWFLPTPSGQGALPAPQSASPGAADPADGTGEAEEPDEAGEPGEG